MAIDSRKNYLFAGILPPLPKLPSRHPYTTPPEKEDRTSRHLKHCPKTKTGLEKLLEELNAFIKTAGDFPPNR